MPSRRAYDFLARPARADAGLLRHCQRASLRPELGLGRLQLLLPARAHGLPDLRQYGAFYASAPLPARPEQPAPCRSGCGCCPGHLRPWRGPAGCRLSPDHDPDTHVPAPRSKTASPTFPAPKKWVDEVPFRTSRGLLLRLLGDTLRRAVVGTRLAARAPTDTIQVLRGLPADSLYRRMLRVSDNFLAEQLLLMCATQRGLPATR